MDCVVSYKQEIAVKEEGGVDCIVMSEELRTTTTTKKTILRLDA